MRHFARASLRSCALAGPLSAGATALRASGFGVDLERKTHELGRGLARGGQLPLKSDEGQNPAPGASQGFVMDHY